MAEDSTTHKTNPEKSASRVAINGIMLGSLVVVLTIIFIDPGKFSLLVTSELVLAIPMLFISSLAYSKIGYWKQTKLWDDLGYFTNTIGNMLLIDSIGVMVSPISSYLAYSYFGIMIFLLLIYSIVNVIYDPKSFFEKILKFLFSTTILTLGGIMPIIMLGR